MRPLLLDTCAVLKLANGEFGKFSRSAMKAMREADILYVSPISEWEISLKWISEQGEVIAVDKCVPTSFHGEGTTFNIKIIPSGEIRTVNRLTVIEINGEEVTL